MARSRDGNQGALSPEVVRRVALMWAEAEERRRVCEALAAYGVASHEREADRVRLAIVKLSNGDVEKALAMVAAAKQDYRDVLMWAEYPEQGRATWALRPHLTRTERRQLEQIRRRDRKQYEEWRKKPGQ